MSLRRTSRRERARVVRAVEERLRSDGERQQARFRHTLGSMPLHRRIALALRIVAGRT